MGKRNPQRAGRSGDSAGPSHKYRATINQFFRKFLRFSPCDRGWFIVQLDRVPYLLDDAVAVREYLKTKGFRYPQRRRAR